METDETFEKFCIDELLKELNIRNINIKLKRDYDKNTKLKDFDSKQIFNFLKEKQRSLYGNSSTNDFFEINNPQILNDADSVVLITQEDNIQDNNDSTSYLKTTVFGDLYDLCPDEKYRKQPVGGFSSGVLVDSDVIATTGHGIDFNNLFIFGFKVKDINESNIVINNSDIYKGKRFIDRELNEGTDWALVKLDRKVINHSIARIRTDGKISDNAKVHVIGHPCGLPLKVGDNAIIKNNNNESYFVANLDAYGGNSGSPVFNSDTHEVEGILVRGETDFISIGSCNKSLICPSTGCRGVDCTRTTTFSNLL